MVSKAWFVWRQLALAFGDSCAVLIFDILRNCAGLWADTDFVTASWKAKRYQKRLNPVSQIASIVIRRPRDPSHVDGES